MIRLPKFSTSVYGLLLWRLLLSLAALTLARVIFLVFNTDLLHLGKTACGRPLPADYVLISRPWSI